MTTQRRDILKYTLAAAAASALPAAHAQAPSGASAGAAATGIDPRDRVFITNEDSNTLVVIDPKTGERVSVDELRDAVWLAECK